jgi:hypothetical protein
MFSCITDRALRDIFTKVLNETLKNTPPLRITPKHVVPPIYAALWLIYYPSWLAL